MADGGTQFLSDSTVLASAGELAEIIGIDLETVNNWLRRGIISRAPIGGRQLRHRLFSTEQVYKAALMHELVKLGISPSSASEAVNEIWKQWDKKEILDGKNIFGIISTADEEWTALLCWQKLSGGPLYQLGKSSTSKPEVIELPKQAFAMLPISEVVGCATKKLAELLNDKKKRPGKNARS